MTFKGIGLDKLKDWVKAYVVEAGVLDAYPVGAIYVSTVATSPSELFGGTWEALEQGRVLIGQGTDYAAGSTGGEKEHAITAAEMPGHTHALGGSSSFSGSTGSAGSHSHTVRFLTPSSSADNWAGESVVANNSNGNAGFPAFFPRKQSQFTGTTYQSSNTVDSSNNPTTWSNTASGGSHSHSVSGTVTLSGNTGSSGSGEAVSLMQPYLAVYMWKRVA